MNGSVTSKATHATRVCTKLGRRHDTLTQSYRYGISFIKNTSSQEEEKGKRSVIG